MRPLCPSEQFEQEQFVNWLQSQDYKFCAFAQSTYTRSWAVKARNTRMGVVPGWPDMCVVLKRGALMFLELKRIRGGTVSPEQKNWISTINACSTLCVVAKGFEAAREAVLKAENEAV